MFYVLSCVVCSSTHRHTRHTTPHHPTTHSTTDHTPFLSLCLLWILSFLTVYAEVHKTFSSPRSVKDIFRKLILCQLISPQWSVFIEVIDTRVLLRSSCRFQSVTHFPSVSQSTTLMNDPLEASTPKDQSDCIICLDCHSCNDGMTCPSGHFVCDSDLNSVSLSLTWLFLRVLQISYTKPKQIHSLITVFSRECVSLSVSHAWNPLRNNLPSWKLREQI